MRSSSAAITPRLSNHWARRLIDHAAKRGNPQPPHPMATAPRPPTTKKQNPGPPSAPTAPTSPPTTKGSERAFQLRSASAVGADADRNWNALSLPFVVGPHG